MCANHRLTWMQACVWLLTFEVCSYNMDIQIAIVANIRHVVQNPEQADDAVEHMCFLTDARQLYSNAMGLYDLELTLLVAQQAQMVSIVVLKTASYSDGLLGP